MLYCYVDCFMHGKILQDFQFSEVGRSGFLLHYLKEIDTKISIKKTKSFNVMKNRILILFSYLKCYCEGRMYNAALLLALLAIDCFSFISLILFIVNMFFKHYFSKA